MSSTDLTLKTHVQSMCMTSVLEFALRTVVLYKMYELFVLLILN